MFTDAMADLAQLQAAESKLLLRTYERNPVLFTHGKGVHLYDQEGSPYLDFLSGIGVCALGYDHPAVTAAITQQAHTLLHTSNLFFHQHTAELALRLTEITGMDRVFLCNSGTEAWEAALKLARAHASLLCSEGARIGSRIIAVEHSFHGRTMGSVSTTHKAAYREPFEPLVPDVVFVPFNNCEALRSAFSDEVCAIAIAVVDTMRQQGLVEHNAALGNFFRAELHRVQQRHPEDIKEVRGLGLMIGVELASAELAKSVLSGMLKRRILINRTHDTVLRFLPPYLITEAHIQQVTEALDELLTAAAAGRAPAPPNPGVMTPEETVHG